MFDGEKSHETRCGVTWVPILFTAYSNTLYISSGRKGSNIGLVPM